jgi:hypothetical protein
MRTMAYRQWHRGSTYLSFLPSGARGGGRQVHAGRNLACNNTQYYLGTIPA